MRLFLPRDKRGEASAFGEGVGVLMTGDDQVVDNLNIHAGECLAELFGEVFVFGGCLKGAAGVVVGEDDGGSIVLKGEFDHFAGINGGLS